MKKQPLIILLILTSLFTTPAFSQCGCGFNAKSYGQFSLELTGGVSLPLTARKDMPRRDYLGPQVQLALRYMFNTDWGMKLHWGYNQFKNNSATALLPHKIDYSRFGIEGVVNLGNIVGLEGLKDHNLALLLHGGFTHTDAKVKFEGNGVTNPSPPGQTNPPNQNNSHHTGGYLFGLTGEYRIGQSDFAIAGDVSFLGNFDTEWIKNYPNLSLGIVYYFGGYRNHADWVY